MLKNLMTAGVLSVAAFVANVANADMIYTGGSLTSMGEETLITGAGSFEIHGVRREVVYVTPFDLAERDVGWGDAELTLDLDRLSLIGAATGYSDVLRNPYAGEVNGTVAFEITTPTTMLRNWEHIGDGPTYAVIYREDGSILTACGYGSCADTDSPLFFAAGRYELRFHSESLWHASIPLNNTFSFSLTPVPLPAAAWLLLSGLGGLGLLGRRRVL